MRAGIEGQQKHRTVSVGQSEVAERVRSVTDVFEGTHANIFPDHYD